MVAQILYTIVYLIVIEPIKMKCRSQEEEFEKKIEKARQEIKLLEAKVKFLRDELGK